MSERKIMSLALKVVAFVSLLNAAGYLGAFTGWFAEFYRPESDPPSFIYAVPVVSTIILYLFFGIFFLAYSNKISAKICPADETIEISEQQSFKKLLEAAFSIIGIVMIAFKLPFYLFSFLQIAISLRSWSAIYHYALPDLFMTAVYVAVGFCLIRWSKQLAGLVFRLKKIPSSRAQSKEDAQSSK